METKTVKVPNIGCSGCVNTIKSEIVELAGVLRVEGDPETKTVTVQWDEPANWESIKGKMTAIAYAPEEA